MLPRGLSNEEKTWTKIEPHTYNDSIFKNPVISGVAKKQMEIVSQFASKDCSLVEVGCGTGKFLLSFKDQVGSLVGVDISDISLEHVRQESSNISNLQLVNGDATELSKVLKNEIPQSAPFWNHKKIIACITNTLGIMPESIRGDVVREMVQALGENGVFFLSVFNARFFQLGLDEFYRKVPALCGPIQDSDINYHNHELRVNATGYFTHWFSEDEVRGFVENAGLKDYEIIRHGVGLMVLGRT